MTFIVNPTGRKTGLFFLKAIIAAISIWIIFLKVHARQDFDQMQEILVRALYNPGKLWLLAAVFALMFGNWLLETAKWKLLLQYISPSGWLRCFRSVMSGVTVSIFTPNRIGEFAGRVLHLDPGVRIRAAIASVIGSMNQLLITILAGATGLLASLNLYVEDDFIYRIIFLLTITGMIAAVYFYFKIPGLSRIAGKFKSLRKLNLYTSVFGKYTIFTLVKLSFLSASRYLVFTFQFVLMLYFFEITIPWQESVKAISVMYLVMAIVPSLALSELTIRGSVALFLFSSYTANSTGILATSSMIWLVNLVLPAFMGALAAFYFRFNK
jgi:Lysylphosphatidylglycerol synthase TM region